MKKFELTLVDSQGNALCLGYDETVEAESEKDAISMHEDYLAQCDVYRSDSVPENMKGYASEYDHIEVFEIQEEKGEKEEKYYCPGLMTWEFDLPQSYIVTGEEGEKLLFSPNVCPSCPDYDTSGEMKNCPKFTDEWEKLSKAASMMGKKGGSAKTVAKVSASRANGKLGGRPRRAIAQAEKEEI